MQYLKVDGTRVRYVGPGDRDSEAATIRANYPVPSDCPLYYFEVKVLDKGQFGYIGVGFCTEDVHLGRLPGWEPHSYGYHGDDGHVFSGSGQGKPFGPPFTAGDVLGALFHRADRTISYFKNGEPLGVAFKDVQEASPLFPCVGLRTRLEEVVANFGTGTGASSEPFRTDFTAIRMEYQRCVMDSVRRAALPLLSSRGTALLPQLLYDYLLHQRCWRTAAVLSRDLLRPDSSRASAAAAAAAGGSGEAPQHPAQTASPSPSTSPSTSHPQSGAGTGAALQLDDAALADIAVRQQTYDLVAAGRIDEALQLLQERYPPELLSERPSLDFRLRLQKFVEMVAASNYASPVAEAAPAAAPLGASPSGPAPTAPPGDAPGGSTREASANGAVAGATGSRDDAAAASRGTSGQGDQDEGAAAAAAAADEGPAPMDDDGQGVAAGASGQSGLRDEQARLQQQQQEEEERPLTVGCEKAAATSRAAARAGVPTTREILSYGTQELRPRCRTATDRDLLTDALSLLAFDDPGASPAGYLLRPAHRVSLAEELNGAMLACRGLPATSPLERLYQQMAVVMAELKRGDHPPALALPDPRSLLVELPPPPALPSTSAGAAVAGAAGGSAAGRASDPMTS